jgi:hypothetical protein
MGYSGSQKTPVKHRTTGTLRIVDHDTERGDKMSNPIEVDPFPFRINRSIESPEAWLEGENGPERTQIGGIRP